jgi:DNA-binding transcriptional ArsR family regulator
MQAPLNACTIFPRMANNARPVAHDNQRTYLHKQISPIALDAFVRAIAHVTRRNILEWLKEPRKHFPEQACCTELGVCLGEIARRCALSQSTVSHHMAQLNNAGLVHLERAGTFRFFKRNEEIILQSLQGLAHQLVESSGADGCFADSKA